MTYPKPAVGQAFPSIELPILGGGTRQLGKPKDGFDWQLIVVYRGKHCPLCTNYLKELETQLGTFNELGVDVIAVSANSEGPASEQISEVKPSFDVAYGLSVEQIQALGLYVSGPQNGMNVEGPFAEPGLFVINDEGKLQIVDISNVPFARPDLTSLGKGIRYIRGMSEKRPINGTFAE